jgi:hypothetical protein
MKVFAIDPGNEQSAWCVVMDGRPYESDKQPNAELLAKVQEWGSDGWLLAVEMIASYGMPVGREVFETCVWIGRLIQAWGGEHTLVYRKDVKLLHCGSTRATDANIRASLIDRFGPGKDKAVGTKNAQGPLYGMKGDRWSALAVGLTAEARNASHPPPLTLTPTRAGAVAERDNGGLPF